VPASSIAFSLEIYFKANEFYKDLISIMNTKEILLTSIIALTIGIVTVIFNVHYEKFIDNNDNDNEPQQTTNLPSLPQTALPLSSVEAQPKDSVTQLKALQISDAPVMVTFWLDTPGKTQFSRHDKLTFYYKINGLNTASYFTLFNVSPSGKLSIVLNNEPIEVGKLYSLPKAQQDWLPNEFVKKETRLRLEVGSEYFKAIVTVKPILWLAFFKEADAKLPQILGIKELEVDVN